jgi:hypothetical protein
MVGEHAARSHVDPAHSATRHWPPFKTQCVAPTPFLQGSGNRGWGRVSPNSPQPRHPSSTIPRRGPTTATVERVQLMVVNDTIKHELHTAMLNNQNIHLIRHDHPASTPPPPPWQRRRPRRCGGRPNGKICFPTEQAARDRLTQLQQAPPTGHGYTPSAPISATNATHGTSRPRPRNPGNTESAAKPSVGNTPCLTALPRLTPPGPSTQRPARAQATRS